ncbi:hypothetical protein HYH02_006227 [Chlamydomonas schloesseri]|uniref:Uncharacterized protein n=1 Tax=Chlamydomonas schloesseri TaxID=2026947 RepID=A0A835WKC5_9CHLO|nr:hypothetical protein HYH02_006227 [Chlamydomonas schloesseri]|eukprot:KAG2448878.1 hypothetical protein HYH02_006227 [Chlamydomonas schloesseri]
MSNTNAIHRGASLWLRAAAGGKCSDIACAFAPGKFAQSLMASLSLMVMPGVHEAFTRQLSSRSHAKTTAQPGSLSADRTPSGTLQQKSPRHSSPRRRRDADRNSRETSAAGAGDTFIRRTWAPPTAHAAAQPSAPATPAGHQPLLRHAPARGAAPLPSLTSCPSLAALNEHVQRHGHLYKLSHVAAGLQVLAQLVPPAPHLHGTAAAAAEPQTQQQSVGSTSGSNSRGHGCEANGSAALTRAEVERRPITAPEAEAVAAEAARLARQCAELLVLVGGHQMRAEDDLASLAACITALARTGSLETPATSPTFSSRAVPADGPQAAAEGQAQPQAQAQVQPKPRVPAVVDLAMPFVERLRAPGYYYHMRSQPPEVLAALLHALGKLRPWAHLPEAERFTFAMVVGRVLSSLHTAVPQLGLAGGVAAAQAMARLHLPVRGHEKNTSFLKAVARHLATDVLPSSRPTPEDSFRLVWAYGELMPGACGTAEDGAGAAAASPPADASTSAPDAARAPAVPAIAAAKPPASMQSDRRPVRSGGADADVGALVAACCRYLRKSLGSAEQLPPRLLARTIRALGKLRARHELQALMPQAAPVLLAHLPSLDTGNLVDVAFACGSNGVAELGLTTAIAEQIAASEVPLALGDVQRLLVVYGAHSAAPHSGLRQRLRAAVVQALDGAARARDLNGLLRVLDEQDEADAELVALVRSKLQAA